MHSEENEEQSKPAINHKRRNFGYRLCNSCLHRKSYTPYSTSDERKIINSVCKQCQTRDDTLQEYEKGKSLYYNKRFDEIESKALSTLNKGEQLLYITHIGPTLYGIDMDHLQPENQSIPYIGIFQPTIEELVLKRNHNIRIPIAIDNQSIQLYSIHLAFELISKGTYEGLLLLYSIVNTNNHIANEDISRCYLNNKRTTFEKSNLKWLTLVHNKVIDPKLLLQATNTTIKNIDFNAIQQEDIVKLMTLYELYKEGIIIFPFPEKQLLKEMSKLDEQTLILLAKTEKNKIKAMIQSLEKDSIPIIAKDHIYKESILKDLILLQYDLLPFDSIQQILLNFFDVAPISVQLNE